MVVLLFCYQNIELQAQRKSDDPLAPAERELDKGFGFVVGLGQSFQSGELITQCPCNFSGGVGISWLFGAIYEAEISKSFDYGIFGFFDNKNLQSSYQESEIQTIYSENELDSLTVPIAFRHVAETGFNTIALTPFIKYNPYEFVYFRLGLKLGYLMSGKVKHTKELLQKTAVINGEIVEVTIGNSKQTSVVVEDGDYPELNSFQLGLMPMIGFNLQIDKNLYFKPAFMFDYSLSNISKQGENFKIHSWKVLLELSYMITEQSKY